MKKTKEKLDGLERKRLACRERASAKSVSVMERRAFCRTLGKRGRLRSSPLSCVLLLIFIGAACTPRAFEKPNVVNAPATNENKLSAFESDLQTMRTAGFEYIFVFRRNDGAAFDSEDRKYLRANAPAETNRFVSTDDGKAFIAGSKYPFPPTNLETLRARFNVEDYSTAK